MATTSVHRDVVATTVTRNPGRASFFTSNNKALDYLSPHVDYPVPPWQQDSTSISRSRVGTSGVQPYPVVSEPSAPTTAIRCGLAPQSASASEDFAG